MNYQCMPFKGGAMLVMDDMTELAGMQSNLISHQERLSAFQGVRSRMWHVGVCAGGWVGGCVCVCVFVKGARACAGAPMLRV